MLTSINNYRDTQGCTYKHLQYDYDLEKAAIQRAAELAVRCENTRPDGENYLETIAEYGFNTSRRGGIYGEVFVYGSNDTLMDLDDAFDSFTSDSSRSENLLSGFECVGIGHIRIENSDFWVILFSTNIMNLEATSPVNGDIYVPLNIPDSLLDSISFEYVSGLKTVVVGSTVDVPVYVAKAGFSSSDLNEIELAPLTFESQNEYVSATSGKMIGLKKGTGKISATVLNKTLEVDISVTDN